MRAKLNLRIRERLLASRYAARRLLAQALHYWPQFAPPLAWGLLTWAMFLWRPRAWAASVGLYIIVAFVAVPLLDAYYQGKRASRDSWEKR